MYARLDGAWHLIDLTAEAQGPAYHVWKAYADDVLGNGISLSPEGKEYIGFAVGQRTEDPDLSDPSLYDWSLIKGADGKDVDPEVLAEILEKQDGYNTSLSDVNDSLSTVDQALADADSRLKAADTALNQAIQTVKVNFSSSIDSLNESIGEVENDLLNLASLNSEQGSSITQLESATDEQAQKISVLETNDGSSRSRLASLESTSSSHASKLSTVETRSINAQNRAAALEETTRTHATRLTNVETKASDTESKVSTLEETSEGHASRLTNVETKVTTAVSKADAAQSTANSGVSKANAAQTAADNAQDSADSANTIVTAVTNRVSTLEETSEGHASRLTNVETKATSAVTKADNAQSTANSGVSKANAAQSSANDANTKITTITNRVSTLEETSEGHASRLTNVETKATSGVNKANAAQSSADDANEKVSAVTNRVSTLEETSEGHASRLTTVETTATSGVNKANAAQSTADSATSKANAAHAKADSVDTKVTTVTNRVSTLETSDADKASRLSAIESFASKSAELSVTAANDLVDSEHSNLDAAGASYVETLDDGFRVSGPNRWRYSREFFKVDPRRKYEIRIKARVVEDSNNGISNLYAGVVPFDEEKREIERPSGGAGTHLYTAASSYPLQNYSDWRELTGVISGVGLSANNFREGTRYVRLMFITGHRGSGTPVTEIDFLEIRDITEVDTVSSRVTTLEETSEGHASRLTTVETTASSGFSKANTAQSTADSANSKANNAQSSADQANEKVDSVTNRVSTLEETSEGHASRLSTVETTASGGVSKANAAQSTANSATTKANSAQLAADNALDSADSANNKVNAVTNRVSTLESTSSSHASRLSTVETTAASGVSKADAAQAKANSADSKVNSVTTRVSTLESTTEDQAIKLEEVSVSRSNIVSRGVFGSDRKRGGWTAGSIVATSSEDIPTLSGRPYVLKLTTRDCYDYSAQFPISVGDKIYISAWVYTSKATVSFNLGFRMLKDGESQSQWPLALRITDRSGKWVRVEGTFTHTSTTYNGAAPFLQLSGSGTMPPAYISDIVYSRSSHSGALAAVTDESKAYVDAQTGELKAERVIKADANGKVSGVHLLSKGSGVDAGGKLYFQADEIAIVPPNWNGTTELDKSKFPFYFSEDRNYMYLDEAVIQKLSAETIDSGRLAVDGLAVLSDDISMPAGSIREYMIDPAFKDGIVRVNPDATIQGGTKSASSTGIGEGKKITVPALESGGSAQTMTISVVGPNEVNRKDVQFDLEMRLNGAPHNFTSGQSKIRLSSTITYSTEEGGVRLYRSTFKFEDQVILPAPTKGNEYTYEFIISNMSFSPASTSTYNFANKLKFSISVSEPTVSSGGFITDVRWDEVKEKPAVSEFSGYKSATCAAGWVTVAESSGSRGYASVYVWDTESSDHSFIHMDVFRSYADQGLTVVNSGGHAQRITGARWIRSSDNTYGRKKLQIYATTSSSYRVIVKDKNALNGFDGTISSVTPTLEDMPSGYSSTGVEVNGLSGVGGSMGVAKRLRIGSGTAWHSANDGSGSGLDADKLDGYQASDFVRKAEQKFDTQDGWLRENGDNDHVKIYGNNRTVVIRTDGTTQYGSNGSYPFIWLYGGDSTNNRLMIINSSGDIWFKKKGEWLGSMLDSKLGKTAKAVDSDKLDGLHASSFALSDHGHTGLGANAWGGLRSTNQYGYIDFGPANESHAHIYTDRDDFYFNKELQVNGKTVWHAGNTNDIAKKSIANTFTIGQKIDATGTLLTLGGSTKQDGSDISLYMGNSPSAYGFYFTYQGSKSGNENSLLIQSTNNGTPQDALLIKQDATTILYGKTTVSGRGLVVGSNGKTIGNNYTKASDGWLFVGSGTKGVGIDENELVCTQDFLLAAPSFDFKGTATFNSSSVFKGNLWVRTITRFTGSNNANQRVDTRDEGDQGRAHWYGENASGGTVNFKHAWYDGSAYVNIDVSNQTVNFSGAVGANGGLKQDDHTLINGTDTWYRTKGNDGIYFSSYGGGWHMTDSTWLRAYSNKRILTGSTASDSIRTYGGLHLNLGVRRDNMGSSWVSQKDSNAVAIYNETAMTVNSYAAVIRQRHPTTTYTIGGLGDNFFGFFSYLNSRTANGTDGYFRMDVHGNCVASGTMMAKATTGTTSRVITYDDFLPATPPAGLENTITAEWIGAGAINARHLQVSSLVNNGGTYTSLKIAPDSTRPLALSKTDSAGKEVAPIFYVDTSGNGFFDGKLSKDTVDIESIQDEARKQINPYYIGTVSGGTQSATNKALSSGGTYVLPAITVLGGKVNLAWVVTGSVSYRDSSSKQGYSTPSWRVEVFRGPSTSYTRIVNRTYTGSAYEHVDNEYGSPAYGRWEGSSSIHIDDQISDNYAANGQRYTIRVTRLSGTSMSINVANFTGKSPAFKQIQMKYEYTSLYYNAAGLGKGNITLSDDYDKYEFLAVAGAEDNDNVMGITLIPTYAITADVNSFDDKQFMLSSPMYANYWRVSLQGKRSLIERGENSLIRRIWGVNIVEKV